MVRADVDVARRVICHCLGVTEDQIFQASETSQSPEVRKVIECTGAGSGCMGCRRRIQALLSAANREVA